MLYCIVNYLRRRRRLHLHASSTVPAPPKPPSLWLGGGPIDSAPLRPSTLWRWFAERRGRGLLRGTINGRWVVGWEAVSKNVPARRLVLGGATSENPYEPTTESNNMAKDRRHHGVSACWRTCNVVECACIVHTYLRDWYNVVTALLVLIYRCSM